MPEMPDVRANRYVKDFNLPQEVADFITDSKDLADYFEACVKAGANPVRAAHWVRTEVLRILNERQLKLKDFTITPETLSNLIAKIDDGKLSTTQAKEVFDFMSANNCGIDEAIKHCGITEGGVAGNMLEEIIKSVISANPDVLEEIKSGRDTKGKKQKFLQGLVMKEVKGQAKPQEVTQTLEKILQG